LIGVFYYPKWNNRTTEATISWDVSGYYLYLPALFIYKDVKHLSFYPRIHEKYRPSNAFDQAYKDSSTGNYVIKYTLGQAVLYSPFFLMAHFITSLSNSYPADGYSYIYQLFIGLGMMMYACIGLYYVRKVLTRFFSEPATSFSLIGLTLATNYLNYAAIDGAMTHNGLFTVYAALLHQIISFHERPTYKRGLLIGMLVGLATLIRPSEMLAALLPLLWAWRGWRGQLSFLTDNFPKLLLAGLGAVALCSLQIGYWIYTTGRVFVYSYGAEGFDWFHPHVLDCLFSYKAGWLIYSPFFLTALAGFVVLYRKHKPLFVPAFVFFLTFAYICFSWQTWWYGGSLGQRALIQSYPVLGLATAALYDQVRLRRVPRTVVNGFLVVCIWYNLWWTHQSHLGGLMKAEEMNESYFWAVVGRNRVDERAQNLLENDYFFSGSPTSFTRIYRNYFDQDSAQNAIVVPGKAGKSILLDGQFQFSQLYFFSVPPGSRYIRATATFEITDKEWEVWKMTQFIIRFYKKGQIVQTNQVRVQRLLADQENKRTSIDAKVPEGEFDAACVLFWNAGGEKSIFIDDLEVIAY